MSSRKHQSGKRRARSSTQGRSRRASSPPTFQSHLVIDPPLRVCFEKLIHGDVPAFLTALQHCIDDTMAATNQNKVRALGGIYAIAALVESGLFENYLDPRWVHRLNRNAAYTDADQAIGGNPNDPLADQVLRAFVQQDQAALVEMAENGTLRKELTRRVARSTYLLIAAQRLTQTPMPLVLDSFFGTKTPRVEHMFPTEPTRPLVSDTAAHAPVPASTFGNPFTIDQHAWLDHHTSSTMWAIDANACNEVENVPLHEALTRVMGRYSNSSFFPALSAWTQGRRVAPNQVGLLACSYLTSLSLQAALLRHAGGGYWSELPIDNQLEARLVLSNALHLSTAVSYLLDSSLAVDVLAADPPTDAHLADLPLPFRDTLVVFTEPIIIPPQMTAWPSNIADDLADLRERINVRLMKTHDASEYPTTRDNALFWSRQPHILESVTEHGGSVEGVVLCADAEQHLTETTLWLVRSNQVPADTAPLPVRGVIAGHLPAATLAPLVRNLAALVSQQRLWTEPDHQPLPGANTAKARAQAAEDPALHLDPAHVHVINLDRVHSEGSHPDGTPTRKTREHRRRGHWRRSRVGHRTDWHHEWRFIFPTTVNQGVGEPVETVYLLPAPSNDVSTDETDTAG